MVKDPRIIFYGTPDFAVPSLHALINEGYSVVAVVTAPDRPSGRGLKIIPSPVHQAASGLGIPVFQPVNLKDPVFLNQIERFRPDLQIVIAFRMLPRVVWTLPAMGTFNLHASLLPQYRGAAPINHAVMNGETMTGLTTFFLNDQIDCGKIILSQPVEIGLAESAGDVHDRMKELGAGLVVETVRKICSGEVKEVDQIGLVSDLQLLKPAPKIFRDDCLIDWNQDVLRVYNKIRGLSPSPGAFTVLPLADGSNIPLKILKARLEPSVGDFSPGSFSTDGKTFLMFASSNGLIIAETVQAPGRKAMNIVDFLRGNSRLFSEQAGN